MSESLGDAVLDLTANLHPLAREIAEARAMVDAGLTGMEQRGQVFDQRFAQIAQSMDRGFTQVIRSSSDSMSQGVDVGFSKMEASAGRYRQVLNDVSKAQSDLDTRLGRPGAADAQVALYMGLSQSMKQLRQAQQDLRDGFDLSTASTAQWIAKNAELMSSLELAVQKTRGFEQAMASNRSQIEANNNALFEFQVGTTRALQQMDLFNTKVTKGGKEWEDAARSLGQLQFGMDNFASGQNELALVSERLTAQRMQEARATAYATQGMIAASDASDRLNLKQVDLIATADTLNRTFGLQNEQIVQVDLATGSLGASYSFTGEALKQMNAMLVVSAADMAADAAATQSAAAANDNFAASANRATIAQTALGASGVGSGGGGVGGGGSAATAGSQGGGGGANWSNILLGASGGHVGRRWGVGPIAIPRIAGAGIGSLGSLAGLGPEHILTTLLGVAGSGVGALGGAAALGSGALGQALVGTGSDALVTSSTISQTKQILTSMDALSKAVAVYGAQSRQAAVAQAQLNQQIQVMGNTAGTHAEVALAKQTEVLKQFWEQQSSSARVASTRILSQILTLGTAYVPMIVAAAERNLTIINSSLKPLFTWLEGPQGIAIWKNLENNFARELPTAIHAFDQGMELVLRIMSIASDYTGGLVKHLDNFFTRMNKKPDSALRDEIEKLIGDFHLWARFLGTLGHVIYDLFHQDTGTGNAVVATLTNMLQKLDDWERSTRGRSQLHNIFELHKQEVLNLLAVLPSLATGFKDFYLLVAPPMVEAMNGVLKVISGILNGIVQLGHQFPIFQSTVVTPLAAMLLLSKALTGSFLKGIPETIRATTGAIRGLTVAESENAIAAEADSGATARVPTVVAGAGGRAGAARLGSTVAEAGSLVPISRASRIGDALTPASAGSALARGALIGLGGSLLFTGIQHQLHSSVGDAIGEIGKDASIGAAIGQWFGPAGLAGGALVGGLVGTFKTFFDDQSKAEAYGREFAKNFSAPFANEVRRQFEPALAKVTADLKRDEEKKTGTDQRRANPLFQGPPGSHTPRGVTPGEQGKIDAQTQKDLFNQGWLAGQEVVKGLQSVKHPTEWGLFTDFRDSLEKLRPAAQNSAAKVMIAFAGQLEQGGKISKRDLAQLITDLEVNFPNLQKYLEQHSAATAHQVASAFNLTAAQKNLKAALAKVRDDWGDREISQKLTNDNLAGNTKKAFEYMQEIIATTTGKAHKQAVAEFHHLRDETAATYSGMTDTVIAKQASMTKAIADGTAGAAQTATTNLKKFDDAVNKAMASGVLSTSTGARLMAEAANATIVAFGGTKIPIPELIQHDKLGKAGLGILAAGGALFQIGQPGDKGGDNIPMSIGGQNLIVGSGEKAAIFNHTQQQVMDRALHREGYAGLTGFFNDVKKPHYMAEGGMLPRYAAGGNVWDVRASSEDSASGIGWTELSTNGNAAARSGHPRTATGQGGWDFATLGHTYPHGTMLKIKSDTTGRAGIFPLTDVGDGSSFAPAIGLTPAVQNVLGGMPPTVQISLADGSNIALASGFGKLVSGSGGFSAGSALAGGTTWQDIKPPGVTHAAGIAGDATKTVLASVAKAINAYGQKQAALVAPVTSGSVGNVPNFPITPGPTPPAVQRALMAAEQLAARNEPYVTGGYGWDAPGLDCSGYVSTVMNAAGLMNGYLLTGGLKTWGEEGPGKWITVGVRGADSGPSGHTMMEIDGKFFESSGHHAGGGPHVDSTWSEPFTWWRHPHGLAEGGMVHPGSMREGEPGHQPTQAQARVISSGGPAAMKMIQSLNSWLDPHSIRMALGGLMAGGGMGTSTGSSHPRSAAGIKSEKPLSEHQKQQLKGLRKGSGMLHAPKATKGRKLPPYKPLPDFDAKYMNDVTRTDNQIHLLEQWQGTIDGMHGVVGVTPIITTTNPDGTTIDTVNWGDPNAPIGMLTGLTDPTTHLKTKSIYDRLREIGSNTPQKWDPAAMPDTELGLDYMRLAGYQEEYHQAAAALKHFAPWLTKIQKDQTKHQNKADGAQDLITRLTHTREHLAGDRADADDDITRKYKLERARVQAASATATFDASQWLTTVQGFLSEKESLLKGSIPNHPPDNYLGDRALWYTTTDKHTAGVTAEFQARRTALTKQAREKKFEGSQKKRNFLLGLSLQESTDRASVRHLYDEERIGINNQITDDLRPHMVQEKKYVTADKAKIKAGVGEGGFRETLLGYLDPKGTIQTSILGIQNVDIPTLLREVAGLTNTTPAQAQGQQPTTNTDAQTLAGLYLTLATQNAQRAALLEQDLLAFKIPEYVGSFATGGVIPGPMGEPKLAMVHGGEEYSGVGKSLQQPIVVQVVVQDGAVDLKKIKAIANDAAVQVTTRMTRGGRSPLPGRGGSGVGVP